MRKLCLFMLVCFLCLGAFSQEITLSFIGQLNNSEYCPMDSVVVTNVTRNWTETIVYPDTIIVVGGTVGNNLNIASAMGLEQNVPNPFDCETMVELTVLQREDVRMQLLDVAGHVFAEYTGSLSEGVHVFDISAANPQTYILNAIIGSRSYSIRMVNVGSGCGCSIKYSGLGKGIVQKFETANEFELGDDMRFVGYATIDGDMLASDTVEQSLSESQCVTLHFTRSLPHVETLAASSVTNLSAILHGRITGNGGSSIIACGFYYGTSEDDLSQNVVSSEIDSVFSCTITGVGTGTTYYRAYATSGAGTGYGDVMSFSPTDILMANGISVSVGCGDSLSFYDSGGADCNYSIDEDMTATFTANGRINLSFSNFNTENSNFDYMYVYDGDTASGNVLLRGWGGNSIPSTVTSYSGTMTIEWHSDVSQSYSGWEAIITADCEPAMPIVATLVSANITETSVTLNGKIIFDGEFSISSCGFYYGTSEDDLSQNVTATLTDSGFSYELTGLAAGTAYYYRAYATNNLGIGYGEVKRFTTSGLLNGHYFVDLGLPSGKLWATCNVGSDMPEGYGDYFAWGETSTKETYDWSTYRWCNGSYTTLTKYCSNSNYGDNGYTDTLITLEPSDDAATANWGEGWRMPTEKEMEEFWFCCTMNWTTINGVYGCIFTGPSGNSIFLPAAGARQDPFSSQYDSNLIAVNLCGVYWTSSLTYYDTYYDTEKAQHFSFDNSSLSNLPLERNFGASVRAICISVPDVSTIRSNYVIDTSATIIGSVFFDGGAIVTERGFVYGTSADNLTERVQCGSGSGSFSASLTGLTSGTNYFYKAYAINSQGIGYGEVKSFTTANSPTPDIIMADGLAFNIACGHTYNFYDSGGHDFESDIFEDMTARFESTGRITLSFSSFDANRYVYMDVYDGEYGSDSILINWEYGNSVPTTVTAYSGTMTIVWYSDGYDARCDWEAIITADCEPAMPAVATLVATNITEGSATLNGNVISDCGAIVTGCGFYCGTSEDNLSQNVTATLTDSGFSYDLTGLEVGTTYYYKAYAVNNEGVGYGEICSFTTMSYSTSTGFVDGYGYVDLGLPSGTLWATCNIGANRPEEYGDLFAWGETTPKETYNWSNYQYCNGGASTLTKYCNDSGDGYNGFADNQTILEPSDDAATVNMGIDWRMPTNDEIHELYDNCTHDSVTQNGVKGIMFTGPNGNSIFLPAKFSYYNNRIYGCYWSSSLFVDASNYAMNLYFESDGFVADFDTYDLRYYGLSVRAVIPPESVPTVSTFAASNISFISATVSGLVVVDGGATVTERGFVYGTRADNLTENLQCGSGVGRFSGNLYGLAEATTYFYRAYATNSEGIAYGEIMSFTTISSAGILMANGINVSVGCGESFNFYDSGGANGNYSGSENMTATFIANGQINLSFSNFNSENSSFDYMYVYDGDIASGNVLLQRWGGNSVPPQVTSYSGTMTIVWHSDGSQSYSGWEATISADCEPIVPFVTTSAASNITVSSVTLNGIVTHDGWDSITACGFYYGTSEDDLSQNVTASISGNEFSYELTGLAAYTSYYYKAYATNGQGTAFGETIMFVTNATGANSGHDYIDLGLPSGTLWATCNVGANNPEDYGDYFAWGETSPKSLYSQSTYRYCNGSSSALTKYCNDTSYGYNGFTDTLTILEPSDDAATANWGEGWHTPTKEEFNELINNCTGTWTTRNGVNGYLFTGSNGNSIFLPAADNRYGASASNIGSRGCYWTNSIVDNIPCKAWDLYFNSASCTTNDNYLREYGLTVRAVCSPGQN